MEEAGATAVPMEATLRTAAEAEAEGEDLEVAVDPDTTGASTGEAEVGREAEQAWGKCSPAPAHRCF